MIKRKLGCNIIELFENSIEENIEIIKNSGFDCGFLNWNVEIDLKKLINKANTIGLEIIALHAPYTDANTLWNEEIEGDHYTEILRSCIVDASKHNIPYVIMHVTFSTIVPKTSHIALTRFYKLILEAEKRNVKILFENAEYVRHIGLLLEYFKSDNIGFCYNIGHEACLTPGIKYTSIFSDRLFCAIFNDNNGFPEDKTVNYKSDLHRIPFDASLNFKEICSNLNRIDYKGPVLLDINNRESYNFYGNHTAEEFYKKAYNSAVKLRDLIEN